jgi:hypothetical protein
MRRTLAIALAALTALALAGIAGAVLRSSGIEEASASFAAGVERYEVRTCTGTDNKTYEIVHARYAGEATGSGDAFTGPIVLHVRSVYNVTDGIGFVDGKLRVRRGDDNQRGWGTFWAVNKGGQLDGLVVGGVNHRYARIVGNLTADYNSSSTGGFSNGKVGGGATGNGAALLVGHRCHQPELPKNSVKLVVKGTVKEKQPEQITITPYDGGADKSCKITSESPSLDGIDPLDHVRAECKTSDQVLTRIHEYRHRDGNSNARESKEKRGDA